LIQQRRCDWAADLHSRRARGSPRLGTLDRRPAGAPRPRTL